MSNPFRRAKIRVHLLKTPAPRAGEGQQDEVGGNANVTVDMERSTSLIELSSSSDDDKEEGGGAQALPPQHGGHPVTTTSGRPSPVPSTSASHHDSRMDCASPVNRGEKRKREKLLYCAIDGCPTSSKSDGLSYHKVPSSMEQVWALACGITNIEERGQIVICSRHFLVS